MSLQTDNSIAPYGNVPNAVCPVKALNLAALASYTSYTGIMPAVQVAHV